MTRLFHFFSSLIMRLIVLSPKCFPIDKDFVLLVFNLSLLTFNQFIIFSISLFNSSKAVSKCLCDIQVESFILTVNRSDQKKCFFL
ncbi:unnamed protein product [Acanthoscelides obtectus]|uniref:Uncharacterized protein n=1 Tax=Acanthoscelides obtectus TaxID=200917 RepID=A0A9P0QA22_ACAOB|nr:unnamed protein product [Acanthoscelides obtectus]CAK1656045.1 hypothetical protein AOBTE_LOCUS19541 [Acanthoscelides obtectus]